MTEPIHSGKHKVQAILVSAGSWYLRQTARAFQERGALAGLYISDKNTTGVDPTLFHRCWSFHIAMKPFYHLLNWPTARWGPVFWKMFPVWRAWFLRQDFPQANVMQAIGPFAKEAFDASEKRGFLKIFDAANSHPVTQQAILEREFKRWNPDARLLSAQTWYTQRATVDIQRADMVLCPSLFVKDSMLEQGVEESKCFVLPFGVNKQVFRPREAAPERVRFICVGDISIRKGHPFLFKVFEDFAKHLPDAELVCVGAVRPEARKFTRNLHPRIRLLPIQTHDELQALYRESTAFVLLSYEEGYARVLAEALSSGLPVIATHESGATTTVKNGEEGFIVPSGDHQAALDALLTLASDRALCQAMGNRAATKSLTTMTWQEYGDRLLQELTLRI
jgi:glycosyltransferase involved in cell wall biosynthesis